MVWIAFELTINCFQSYLILLYTKRCLHLRSRHLAADVGLFLSCCVFLSLLLIKGAPEIDILIFLFPLVYSIYFSPDSPITAIYWTSVLALIFTLVTGLISSTFSLLLFFIRGSSNLSLSIQFVYKVVVNLFLYLVILYVSKSSVSYTSPRKSTNLFFLIMMSSILLTEESLYYLHQNFNAPVLLPFLFAYLGLIACMFLSVLMFHIVSDNAYQESRYQAEISLLNLSKQHQQELSQTYSILLQRQHDFKHHIQALESLIQSKHDPEAIQYIESLNQKEFNTQGFFITGSFIVDALLESKRLAMQAHGIHFSYTPYPLSKLPIATLDFCSILGNLLDNAIEGVLRIPNPPIDAIIHLSLHCSWNMFYILCENPCNPDTIIRKKDGFVSSKPSETLPNIHGIGLHNIYDIVNRAEGRAQFYVEDQVFCAKIVLPYSDSKNE